MDPTVLGLLVILVLACVGAALSWRSVASYICIAVAVIALLLLLPGGPI
jgi:hypothetical protein